MNKGFSYEEINAWNDDSYKSEPSPIQILASALVRFDRARDVLDGDPAFDRDPQELRESPAYHYKSGSFDDPDVVASLTERGLIYRSTEMGGCRYLVLAPKGVAPANLSVRYKMHFIIHNENYDDPMWAMKTLRLYNDEVEATARGLDRVLIFVISRSVLPQKLTNIVTKGVRDFCGDKSQVLIDVSDFLAAGSRLSDIPGFVYTDADGNAVSDIDGLVTKLDGAYVLNMARMWFSPFRPEPLGDAGDGTVDKEWLMHSRMGYHKHWTNRFVSKYGTWQNPEVQRFWSSHGLRLDTRYINGERWAIFMPTESSLEKLPVVVCFIDVCEPVEYSILFAYGEYKAYCDIAAHGECAVIFFSMENPDYADWVVDILSDASKEYPIDLSRVYVTGHSRNGQYVQEFARRNPMVPAAIVALGNSPGLPSPEVSQEAVPVDDGRAALMETMDMPTAIICGCRENGCLIPINKPGHATQPGIQVEGYGASAEGKIHMWNRRLKAERCPQQNEEELMGLKDSPNKVLRELGILSDKTELLWLDGFEHYIADIKNTDGKYHFRVVGVENQPHTIDYTMNLCGWNFMRRFSRDLSTGEVIELF